jgi:uncharacterized protein with PQ loop repeat
MDAEALATAAFAVGTAGNLVKGVPQFVRTAVRGHVSGLSAGSVWLAVITHGLWASFGAAISDIAFLALSLFGLLITSATATRFASLTGRRRNTPLGVAAVTAGATFATLAALGADQLLAVIGVTLGLLISVPQLLHLVRIRGTDQRVSGVSAWEYLVVITAQVGWTSYWLLSEQWLVAAGAAWGGLARGVTLALLLRQASHAAAPTRPAISAAGPARPARRWTGARRARRG